MISSRSLTGAAVLFAAMPAMASTITLSDGFGDPSQVTVAPGGSFTLNVILDADVPIFGASYQLESSANGIFSITGRTISGSSPLSDANAADSAVLDSVSALLNPRNDDDLGSTKNAIPNAPAGVYTLGTLTLSLPLSAATGSYSIFTVLGMVNDSSFNEFTMADSIPYTVTVAVPEPTSLSVLAVAGLLLGRRRSA